MAIKKKALQAAAGAAGGAEALAIEDVFSTYLYTGTGTTNTITNGIDLAGEGGLVWTKQRTGTENHLLTDTDRGLNSFLRSNSTVAQYNDTLMSSFNNNGYTISSSTVQINSASHTYASWTFRKAPRFFDVVTYTGDGVAGREIAHNLGCEVGFMVVKCTSTTGGWYAYHRTLTTAPETDYIAFNETGLAIDSNLVWNDTLPTSTHFTLGTNTNVNGAGKTFVAYLFAHDPLGPSGDGSDGLIACGTAGANGTLTDLGWEPQWLLLRYISSSGSNWIVVDNMRGVPTGGLDKQLNPNLNAAETDYSSDLVEFDPRGFIPKNAQSFRYIAIRRGPMRQPTSGTEVFAMDTYGSTTPRPPALKSGFPVDFGFWQDKDNGGSWQVDSRLVQGKRLTFSASAETSSSVSKFDYQTGYINDTYVDSTIQGWMWKRASGFFDVVAYTGNSTSNRAISHNLNVVPEMVWIKCRSDGQSWVVDHKDLSSGQELYLNAASAATTYSPATFGTHTSSTFNLVDGTDPRTNYAGQTFIAYLFASLDGVSKVGSFVGNGANGRIIDCGFSTGARFVLMKCSTSSGQWYVWDSARGIVSGNDPWLALDTTYAQQTSNDYVDPHSSGFIVNTSAADNINVSGRTYIYYAIA